MSVEVIYMRTHFTDRPVWVGVLDSRHLSGADYSEFLK